MTTVDVGIINRDQLWGRTIIGVLFWREWGQPSKSTVGLQAKVWTQTRGRAATNSTARFWGYHGLKKTALDTDPKDSECNVLQNVGGVNLNKSTAMSRTRIVHESARDCHHFEQNFYHRSNLQPQPLTRLYRMRCRYCNITDGMSLYENSLRREEKYFVSLFLFSPCVGIAACSSLSYTDRPVSYNMVNWHDTNQVGREVIHCKFQGRISLKIPVCSSDIQVGQSNWSQFRWLSLHR